MTTLPDGWDTRALGDIANVVRGVTYKKSDAKSVPAPGYMPLLRATNIGSSLDLDGPMVYVPTSGVNGQQILISGDIVLATSSGSLSVVGKNARLLANWNGTFGAFCAVIRSGPEVDSRYLALYLSSHPVRQRWSQAARGTNINNLKKSNLMPTPVPLPRIDEQRRIAEILEDHLSRLDAGVFGLRETVERLRLLKISSLAHNVRSHEESENGTLMFGDQTLALAPGWVSGHVAQAAELVEYGTSSKTHEGQLAGDVPVLRMGNVKDGRLVWGSLKYLASDSPGLQKIMLRQGDLLFNRTNSAEHVGKSAVYEGEQEAATFASYLIRVRFRPEVDPRWASMVINSPYGRAYVTSVTSQQVGQANVNGTKLKAFPLPFPSLGEQITRIRHHAEVVDQADRLLFEVQTSAQRLQSLRQSLLHAAFSGRLTGHSTDMEMVKEMAGV